MPDVKLPAVASNFYTFCSKCSADRYFKVLAHKTSSSASIQCEVCGAKKTYKLESTGKGQTKVKAKTKASTTRAARDHSALFEGLRTKFSHLSPVPYTVKTRFEMERPIEHPKFGLGYIQSVAPDKIEVVFSDASRFLIHNR